MNESRHVALRQADGSWDLDARLARAISRTIADVEAEMPNDVARDAQRRRAWATSVAIDWLAHDSAAREVEWHRLADKARALSARCR